MKAVVFHGVGDLRLENVAEPTIRDPTDALVRLTASAICGTDLHMVRGTLPGMKPGTILGHEGVGVVQEVGRGVRNLRIGDRVVIPSTIACGNCSYCRGGYHAQCDNANPKSKDARQSGTAFFGGPESTGPFAGLQAEYARIPFAQVGLVKLPPEVTDDEAILISDIFPTGYFGADLADLRPGHTVAVFGCGSCAPTDRRSANQPRPGHTVAVFGCGPVGQFAIASARLFDAGRIFAIDAVESRLEMARDQGAEIINFEQEDPVEALMELTGGIGADRVIEAVGVDAVRPRHGPAAKQSNQHADQFEQEVQQVSKGNLAGQDWFPGDAPSQALRWCVKGVAKAGTISIIGVYPPSEMSFPIGRSMMKNLTIRGGNCNHRKYLPHLVEIVRAGRVKPTQILTKREPLMSAIDAYKTFAQRRPGWMKVKLDPAA